MSKIPECHREIVPGYRLSWHAWQRMSGRHITPEAVRAAIIFGREVHQRRAVIHVIGRNEVAWSRGEGVDLAPFAGIHVIVAPDGTVSTVYRNRELSGLERDWRPRRAA